MRRDSQQAFVERALMRDPVKVIAVTSGKGGVGKTNVAVNLAVALGQCRRNVMLLDADLSLANVDVLLGLQPRFNLSHVVRGDADLDSTILQGPGGIRIVPATSGNHAMTELPAASQAAIIHAFSELADQPDVLVVDTAAGISPSVARFVQASQQAVVVVCDEPASITDAYALIKVFSRHYGVSHFQIVTNQTRNAGEGHRLFDKIRKVTDSYLDVVLRHLGDIPQDRFLRQAVQEQRAVVDAYPGSHSSRALRQIAQKVDELRADAARGGIEFFFERLLSADVGGIRSS
ncbi:MAG: MinD/ParA family protein [Woeseia sp.]